MRGALYVLLLTSLCGNTYAENNLPPEFELVQKYILEKDYPEMFDDKGYRIKARDVIVEDIDNDGFPEVLLHVMPHFRQSPTIIIYKIDKDRNVSRVTEGLAPGPLVEVNGDYLDSHTTDGKNSGIDFSVEFKDKTTSSIEDVRDVMLKDFGGVVHYQDFFHADLRAGGGMYIDMRHVGEVPGKDTCEKFQFSEVDKVMVMDKKDDKAKYIVAVVGKQMYAYRIAGIDKNGFLDKSIQVIDAK